MTDSSSNRSGGINFGGNIGNLKVGGDMVSGDKITTTTNVNTGGGAYVGGDVTVGSGKFVGRDDNSQTGLSGDEVSQLFASIYQQIDAKTDLKPSDKKFVKADVQDVEAEVAKGDQADENVLERHLHSILRMAPDILDVIASTFASPTLGVATVIRKVIAKVKQEAA